MTKVHEYMTLARYMYVERKTAVLDDYYKAHETIIYQEKKERILILNRITVKY